MWRRVWNWLLGRQPLPHVTITLYTRAGCHLCDIADAQLRQAQLRYGFHLEHIDVDSSAELAALHGETVPVAAVNGKVRFRGTINPILLRRLLDAEGK